MFGVTVSPSSICLQKKQILSGQHQYLQSHIIEQRINRENLLVSFDNISSPSNKLYYVTGDNVDLTISLTYVTTEKQRKSLHGCLAFAIRKRIVNDDLPNLRPKYNF
jgi:hypothetical protein